MVIDTQLKYLIGIYLIATILTFALDWQLPGFQQLSEFSKKIDLERYIIPEYMTYWQLTHFLTRVLLGFFSPNYWKIIFVVDFGWETLEWYKWGAHNWYDLIWNMLGLITGMMIRHYGLLDRFFNKSGESTEESNEGKNISESESNDQNENNVVEYDKKISINENNEDDRTISSYVKDTENIKEQSLENIDITKRHRVKEHRAREHRTREHRTREHRAKEHRGKEHRTREHRTKEN